MTTKKPRKKPAKKAEVDPYELPPALQQAAIDQNMSDDELKRALLHRPTNIYLSRKDGNASFLPGACVDGTLPLGQTQAEVVVVTGMPKKGDKLKRRVTLHKTALEILQKLKAPGLDSWYVTAGVKFIPEINVKKPKKAWSNLCRPLMLTELQILNPKYVLLMGSEAVHAVLGKTAALTKIRGDVIEIDGRHIMATMNPSALRYAPEQADALIRDMRTFVEFIQSGGTKENYVGKYEKITNLQQCCNVVDAILERWKADPGGRHRLAIDCEWGSLERSDYIHGQLRSIQFSDKAGRGWTIVLRRAGMVYNADTCCSEPEVVKILKKLVDFPGAQVGGHNFREDMHWLYRLGLDCRQAYLRGIDTMLAYHTAYPEEDAFGLEQLALRYTDLGRYDLAVQAWRDANGYGDRSEALERHGYAYVPDDLLFDIYAPADVDVVMHAWDPLEARLKDMKVAKPYKLHGSVTTVYDFYRAVIHPCAIPLFEMEEEGIAPDIPRLKGMTELVSKYMVKLEDEFRVAIKWPEFNIRSVNHVREVLFGSNFTAKPDARPDGAVTLGLTPISTTEKPARKWAEVPDRDKEAFRAAPATSSETLKIYGVDQPLVYKLQQLKFIDQLRKNFLRPPTQDADGKFHWDGGLVADTAKDGRIHTTLSQLTETGRYRSYKPNLQNLPKKQEAELRKIFTPDLEKLLATPKWGGLTEQELKDLGVMDPDYYTLRSCFVADPGHVIIEADYRQAELFTMAHLAGDKDMIAMLSDPDMDFHSEMAVRAFDLPCDRAEVKKTYPAQRVMAKNVTFGGLRPSAALNSSS